MRRLFLDSKTLLDQCVSPQQWPTSREAVRGCRRPMAHHATLGVAVLAVLPTLVVVPPAEAAAVTVVNINTNAPAPLPPALSGVNVPQLRNGVEYFDPKFVAVVSPLKPGCLRFPAGTASMAYDWQAGHMNMNWLSEITPLVDPATAGVLNTAQVLTQAKGGVWLSDFATFANNLGSPATMCFNGYTDNNPSSATQMALAAQSYGIKVMEWEISNEPYLYPLIFPLAATYASSSNVYFNNIESAVPTATVGLFSAGLFPGANLNNGIP